MLIASFRLNLENEHIVTQLCVYVDYNVLGLYIKLFAWYNNIFLWRLVKPKTGLKPVFNNQKPVFQKIRFNIPSVN